MGCRCIKYSLYMSILYMYFYIYIDVKFDEVGIDDSLFDCFLQNHLSRDIYCI